MPASLQSTEPGERSLETSHVFDRPGDYLVKLEYTESPGQEILEFPLRVTRSGESAAGGALELVATGVLGVAVLALARAVASRRRRRLAEPGDPA